MDKTVLLVFPKSKEKNVSERNWHAYRHVKSFVADNESKKNKKIRGFFIGGKKIPEATTLFEAVRLAKEVLLLDEEKS